MGSIGAAELILVALIALVVFAVPIGIVIWAVTRNRGPAVTGVTPGLVHCRACAREVSVRARACPHCGEPAASL